MKLQVPGEFTGFYGAVEFANGVSVNTVSPKQANQVRAAMSNVHVMEDDGVTVDAVLDTLFPIVPLQYFIDQGMTPPSQYLTNHDGGYPFTPEPVLEGKPLAVLQYETHGPYSRADLEAVADTKGIAGLREIGEVLQVKSNSIAALIESILGAQTAGVAVRKPDVDSGEQTGEVVVAATGTPQAIADELAVEEARDMTDQSGSADPVDETTVAAQD